MTSFYILTDTGRCFGPFSNILIARREAKGKIAGNKLIKQIEIRSVFSRAGGKDGVRHAGSFYEKRKP